MILILPITKIFLKTWDVDKNQISLLILTKIFRENHMFICFQPKIDFWLFIVFILNMFKILRARLHYYVTYVGINEKRRTIAIHWLLVATIRVQGDKYIKSRWELQIPPPPSQDVLQKNASGERRLKCNFTLQHQHCNMKLYCILHHQNYFWHYFTPSEYFKT